MPRTPVGLLIGALTLVAGTRARTTTVRGRLAAAEQHAAGLQAELAQLSEEARLVRLAKEDFLATLSHELRTPLNAMLGWIQLLRLHSADPSKRERAIDVVERNARQQAQLIADLLDVSMANTGRMTLALEEVDLADVIHKATGGCKAAALAKGISMQVDAHRTEAVVRGDWVRLQQVVWNLVSNAIKFTPPGGRVAVRLRVHESAGVIDVVDNGIGITKGMLPHVFDRFRQGENGPKRRFGGLGLGLALVKVLAELHGGSGRAFSAGPGSGAVFVVRLPLA